MATNPYAANQSDFLGEGLAAPARAPIMQSTPLQDQERALAKARFNATQNNVPYGTPISQGGSAQGWQVTPTALGQSAGGGTAYVARAGDFAGPNGAFQTNGQGSYSQYDAQGNRIPEATTAFSSDPVTGMPNNIGTPGYTHSLPGAGGGAAGGSGLQSLASQVQSARDTGAGFVGYGDKALQRTQQQSNSLLEQGQGYNPQAQSVAPGFGVGQRGAAPGMVDPGQLGALNTNIAGRLGAAPQVNRGNVGMVTPQLGQQGVANADQQGMLGRLNSFLDAPQGPSVAAAQLQQTQADNAAQLIGAARSGRGTGVDQAEALREAMSAGSGLMSTTAGQLATLRAQEEDMRANRQLSGIGLGGQMATAQRGQDLGFRGQELAARQGDQGAQLGLEQLSGQLGLGARGQNLGALQSDQGAQLGARGQTLGALQGNQGTQLGARGQDLQARAQDLGAITGDADRDLAAQQLGLQGQMGLSGLGLQAQGQGLQYSSQQNALGLGAEGYAQDAINNANRNAMQERIASGGNATQLQLLQNQINSRPGFGEQLAGNVVGGVGNALGGAIVGSIFGGPVGAVAGAAGGALTAGSSQPANPYYTTPQNNYDPGIWGGAGGVY